jgi:peptidoglycan hydrolase CwlO-like protein
LDHIQRLNETIAKVNEKETELKTEISKRDANMKEMRHDLSELKVKNIQFEDKV